MKIFNYKYSQFPHWGLWGHDKSNASLGCHIEYEHNIHSRSLNVLEDTCCMYLITRLLVLPESCLLFAIKTKQYIGGN